MSRGVQSTIMHVQAPTQHGIPCWRSPRNSSDLTILAELALRLTRTPNYIDVVLQQLAQLNDAPGMTLDSHAACLRRQYYHKLSACQFAGCRGTHQRAPPVVSQPLKPLTLKFACGLCPVAAHRDVTYVALVNSPVPPWPA